MTENQKKLVELDKKKAEVKKFYEELKQTIEEVKKEVGIGGFFQDSEGIVYQVVEPDGKYVTFERTSYIRTKRDGELRGELSVKKAEEAGFKVK